MCNCKAYQNNIVTYGELEERCHTCNDISIYLEEILFDSTRWFGVLKCNDCEQTWAKEYPFSEYHGGGNPCYYRIETNEPIEWLKTNEPFTSLIRDKYLDEVFYKSLGNEIGPNKCVKENCELLSIRSSVLCKRHHYEMIKGSSCPY